MKNIRVSVIGLGYVGLPVAVEFGKNAPVIGFDVDRGRIEELKNNIDRTNEVDLEDLKSSQVHYTFDPQDLKTANFHIAAVPTPITETKQPDMSKVISASKTIGSILKKGDTVVYESTVYPGATEEECIPVLEGTSGLVAGVDFKVGYSPERINPGDKEHTFKKIIKVVSGQDQESLDLIAKVYSSVVEAGVYKAESIKVAEASKVIENTQRDLNIAFMNELSLIFQKMNIDTKSVLEAAGTKWNFLKFFPGLVGGHCIGVDPFYLTYKSEKLGYHPHVILAGRRINDNMGNYVAEKTIQLLVHANKLVKECVVNIYGLTFKENIPDVRNTRVTDIYNALKQYGLKINICDPHANPDEIQEVFGQKPVPINDLPPADAFILATPHQEFLDLPKNLQFNLMKTPNILVDVKGAMYKSLPNIDGLTYWRL